MKKIISILVIIVLMIPFNAFAITMCNDDTQINLVETEEEKIYCTATIDDSYEEYKILISFKSSASVVNKVYTAAQLTEMFGVNIIYVRDLTRVNNPNTLINCESFHQILSLKIDTPGKQAVLDAIKTIEQHDDILCAEPNYVINLEPMPQNPSSNNISMIQDETINEGGYELTSTTSNDPYRSRQYAINAMELPKVWDITTGSSTLLVGVLDTGIDGTHPDLVDNINTSLGVDYTTTNGDPWTDPIGHGTHVAGIIGATGNNGVGVTGVCWNVKMVSFKIFTRVVNTNGSISGLGDQEKIVDVINYSRENNIKILNYSGGGYIQFNTVQSAIANYDGLLVCAAGNDSENTDAGTQHYPSGYTCENIISVASINSSNSISSFSNYGPTSIDLGAYGESILSTYPVDLCGSNCTKEGHVYTYYHDMSGTSMATPQVTGLAALIKSCYSSFTPAQIKQYILAGVVPTSGLNGKVLTGGRVNAYNSIIHALVKGVPSNQNATLVSGKFKYTSTNNVACFLKSGATRTSLVTWSVNEGNTTLNNASVMWTGTSFNFDKIQDRVVSGDFNGDGIDDIAALYDYGNNSTGIHLWRGSSSGIYSYGITWSGTSFNASCTTGKVIAGDFDGDGKDDIATFYDYGNNETGLFLWRGTSTGLTRIGKVWSSTSYNAANITGKVTAGDFNGDGKDDIATFYYYGNNLTTMFIWRGNSSSFTLLGQSTRWSSSTFDGTKMDYKVTSGDYDGDGKDDITAFYYVSITCNRVFVWRGTSSATSLDNGSGTTEIYGQNPSYINRKMTAVDMDQNGFCDIWYLYNGEHHWLYSSAGEFYIEDYNNF